jgi:hypothetical protein
VFACKTAIAAPFKLQEFIGANAVFAWLRVSWFSDVSGVWCNIREAEYGQAFRRKILIEFDSAG